MQIHEASADYGTVVPKTAVALIVHANGDCELVTPGNGTTIRLPTHQAVICAIANKLTDPDWIDEILEELIIEGLAK